MTSRIKGLEELEDLVRAKEFLYKVQGEYYIIGANMCRQCRDTILIQHFETYLGALHEVLDEIEGSDTKEAEPSSIKQLLEAYKLIRATPQNTQKERPCGKISPGRAYIRHSISAAATLI